MPKVGIGAHDETAPAGPDGPTSVPGADGPVPPSIVCQVQWCRAPIPAGVASCPRCGDPVPRSLRQERRDPVRSGVVLGVWARLPGGVVVTVAPGELLVLGRESPDARVADALDSFADVSRRHAQVEVTEADVRVADVGSSFGTRLDDFPLEGVAILLDGSHSLALAGHAVVTLDVLTDRSGGA